MPVAVVKLGSSVVAHDSGELRLSVVARVCEEVAGLPRVLALSKADLVSPEAAEEAAAAWAGRMGEDVPVIVTSSATRQLSSIRSVRRALR